MTRDEALLNEFELSLAMVQKAVEAASDPEGNPEHLRTLLQYTADNAEGELALNAKEQLEELDGMESAEEFLRIVGLAVLGAIIGWIVGTFLAWVESLFKKSSKIDVSDVVLNLHKKNNCTFEQLLPSGTIDKMMLTKGPKKHFEISNWIYDVLKDINAMIKSVDVKEHKGEVHQALVDKLTLEGNKAWYPAIMKARVPLEAYLVTKGEAPEEIKDAANENIRFMYQWAKASAVSQRPSKASDAPEGVNLFDTERLNRLVVKQMSFRVKETQKLHSDASKDTKKLTPAELGTGDNIGLGKKYINVYFNLPMTFAATVLSKLIVPLVKEYTVLNQYGRKYQGKLTHAYSLTATRMIRHMATHGSEETKKATSKLDSKTAWEDIVAVFDKDNTLSFSDVNNKLWGGSFKAMPKTSADVLKYLGDQLDDFTKQ